MTRLILVLALLLLPAGTSGQAFAKPEYGEPRDGAFKVPAMLRARVNFWKDIFTRYGKNQVVFHHRDYPQVTFGVVDFGREAESLNPVQLDVLKKRVLADRMNELKQVFKSLADGGKPANALEERVEWQMRGVPGGADKFKKVLDQDLIRTQTGIREKFADAIRRSGRYLGVMESIFVEGYGLPVELTRLPFVESSFDYTAYSSVGAAGIWQFMPATGKFYMTVNKLVDERRDPVESSKAAAKYLKSAYGTLGSWPLAIVSYNHGVAGVANKVKKMGTTDLAKIIEHPGERALGFASNNFYPEFLAALEVYDNYKVYFPSIRLEPELKLAQVTLRNPVSIPYVTRQLGIDVATLRQYNYALAEPIWSGRTRIPAGYTLKLPTHVSSALESLQAPEPYAPESSGSTASSVYGGVIYTVRRGDTLSSIAKKYKTTASALAELNDLEGGKVRIGQKITVSPKSDDGAGSSKPSAVSAIAPKVKPVKTKEKETTTATIHKVGAGESLYSIAKQHNTSVKELKRLNKLKDDTVKAGQKLVVR